MILKFIYSEKATKFCKISALLLSYVVPVKSKVEIFQNFVAFSEFMNFNTQRERAGQGMQGQGREGKARRARAGQERAFTVIRQLSTNESWSRGLLVCLVQPKLLGPNKTILILSKYILAL